MDISVAQSLRSEIDSLWKEHKSDAALLEDLSEDELGSPKIFDTGSIERAARRRAIVVLMSSLWGGKIENRQEVASLLTIIREAPMEIFVGDLHGQLQRLLTMVEGKEEKHPRKN